MMLVEKTNTKLECVTGLECKLRKSTFVPNTHCLKKEDVFLIVLNTLEVE